MSDSIEEIALGSYRGNCVRFIRGAGNVVIVVIGDTMHTALRVPDQERLASWLVRRVTEDM